MSVHMHANAYSYHQATGLVSNIHLQNICRALNLCFLIYTFRKSLSECSPFLPLTDQSTHRHVMKPYMVKTLSHNTLIGYFFPLIYNFVLLAEVRIVTFKDFMSPSSFAQLVDWRVCLLSSALYCEGSYTHCEPPTASARCHCVFLL